MPQALPIVVKSSRGYFALMSLLGIAMLAATAFVLRLGLAAHDGGQIALGVFGLLFFGLCEAIALIRALRPVSITITQDGLAVAGPLTKAWSRGWGEVNNFRIVKIRSSSLIGFDYTSEALSQTPLAKLNHGLAGIDASLPPGWSRSNAEMLDILNQAHAAWQARQAP